MVQHPRPPGVFQLGHPTPGLIHAIHIPLPQGIEIHQGFSLAELVPQGELVLDVGLKILAEMGLGHVGPI